MSRPGKLAPLILAALPLAPALPALADCELGLAAAADGGPQVLTLAEAAAFLRLDQESLARAAARGEVPGRRIAGAWRFARPALIAWLAGADRPAECFQDQTARQEVAPHKSDTLESSSTARDGLAAEEMASIIGSGRTEKRGTAVAQAEAGGTERDQHGAAPDTGKRESFGEEPELGTAREVALRRELVLTAAGQLTVEADLFYTNRDRDLSTVLPVGPGDTFATVAGEQKVRAYGAVGIGRYGILDDLELVVSVPWLYRTEKITVATPSGDSTLSDSSEGEFGDVGVGVQYALLAEGPGRPAVIVSADSQIPTDGSEAFSLGGGFSLVKSIDPTALFASLSYLHTFNAESRDFEDLAPEDAIGATLGFSFAMNDRLAFGTAVTGVFTPHTELDDVTFDSDEVYSLRLSLTSLLTEALYVEPSVSFSLNRSDGVTFGLSLPYTFDGSRP